MHHHNHKLINNPLPIINKKIPYKKNPESSQGKYKKLSHSSSKNLNSHTKTKLISFKC